MRRAHWIALILVACAEPPPTHVAPTPRRPPPAVTDQRRAELERAIAPLVEPIVAQRSTRAVGVTVVENGRAHVFGFGRRNATDARAPDGDTHFEIGSISKGFAGILLADAAIRGEVALADPVRKYLPDDFEMRFEPSLEQIGMMTSGFPLMPDNWIPLDPDTRRTRYTEADFRTFLRKFVPAAPAGEHFSYSNVDSALLAIALSTRHSKPYPEVLRERLFRPLGMNRSDYADRPSNDPNRLDGHDDQEQRRPPRLDVSPLAPCCVIRTTLNDMGRFMHGVMLPKPSAVSRAFQMAARPRKVVDSDGHGAIGFGWFVESRYGSVTKNGQVEGYRSVLTLFPGPERGVFVVVNSETVGVDKLVLDIIDAIFAPRPNGLDNHASHVVAALPDSATAEPIEFGDSIRLEGWTAPACVKPGETMRVAYYYRCLRKLDHDWKIFVHGDAPTRGTPRLRGDHYPAKGRDTTLDWKPGELVADELELVVPNSYPSDTFTLWTGWYRGSSRLPGSSKTREVVDDRARGPTISVGNCR